MGNSQGQKYTFILYFIPSLFIGKNKGIYEIIVLKTDKTQITYHVDDINELIINRFLWYVKKFDTVPYMSRKEDIEFRFLDNLAKFLKNYKKKEIRNYYIRDRG